MTCRGVIVTARSDDQRFDFLSRFFAPAAGIAVPRAWPGLRDGRFALGLVPAAAKAPLPGVLAHQYFGHADGSMLVLYAWLRIEAGLAPDVAFEEAVKRSTGVRRADVRDLLPTHVVA